MSFLSMELRKQMSEYRDWPRIRVYDFAELQNITAELARAREKHPGFPTIHHALSVIREEYLELERAAFIDGVTREPEIYNEMKKEAIQVCASCIRLLVEL